MAHYRMLVDTAKCMNCGACVLGCQQRNSVPYGYYRNWIRVFPSRTHMAGAEFQPGGCMQCEFPVCVDACPTLATWKGVGGVVMIDRRRCIGCGACIAACPYDARYRHPTLGVADKCDYCASTRSLGVEPACVQLCPTRVRLFGNDADSADPVAKALAAGPLVYVKSKQTPTGPTLAYIGQTTSSDWPRAGGIPAPIAAMSFLATGIRWLAGLSFFGVVAMFFKQLVLPSDKKGTHTGSDMGGLGG